MLDCHPNRQIAGLGRCADRHETRVAARGRAVGMADRSSGRMLL